MGEAPITKRRFKILLDARGLTESLRLITPEPASADAVLRVHSSAYLERLIAIGDSDGGHAGPNTPLGRNGLSAALLAAGACIDSVNLSSMRTLTTRTR